MQDQLLHLGNLDKLSLPIKTQNVPASASIHEEGKQEDCLRVGGLSLLLNLLHGLLLFFLLSHLHVIQFLRDGLISRPITAKLAKTTAVHADDVRVHIFLAAKVNRHAILLLLLAHAIVIWMDNLPLDDRGCYRSAFLVASSEMLSITCAHLLVSTGIIFVRLVTVSHVHSRLLSTFTFTSIAFTCLLTLA